MIPLTSAPCAPWCTVADLRCGAQDASPTPVWTDAEYIEAASSVLFELSGRRFPGMCTVVEYPTSAAVAWREEIVLNTNYRVTQIIYVKERGVLVSPLEYEVRDWSRLVRLPNAAGQNPGWWINQIPNVYPGPGTLEVSYEHGEPVPVLGLLAAAALTCSLRQLWCTQIQLTPVQLNQQAIRAALEVDTVATFLKAYPKPEAPVTVWWPEADDAYVRSWP